MPGWLVRKERNEPNSAASVWATCYEEPKPAHTKAKCRRKATLLTVLAAATSIAATLAFPDTGNGN